MAAIGAAIVTAVAGSAFAATATGVLAAGLINGGLSLGLSFATNALFGAKKPPPNGLSSELERGGAIPRTIHTGRHLIGGHFVYTNSFPATNNNLQRVYCLSDWHGGDLRAVWDGENRRDLTAMPIPAGNNEDENWSVHHSYFINHWNVRYFRGGPDQLADTELVNNAQPSGRMSADDRFRGISYISQTYIYFKNGWESLPKPKFERESDLLYDWRKDSTAGGVGTHRWDDPTTWESSNNPIVGLYNFMRGFYRNGQLIIGMGMPAGKLSLDHFTAAANICDETLTEDGKTVKRYEASVRISEDQEWATIINAYLNACGGSPLEFGGVFMPVAGGAQIPVASLTEADLAYGPGVKVKWRAKRTRAELFNEVHGTYINTESGWQATPYDPVTDVQWLAEDAGEPLRKQVNFNQVMSGHQAVRLAQQLIRRNRLQAHGNLPLTWAWFKLTPGDWINYTNAQGGTRTYRIEKKSFGADGVINFEVAEISSWVYGDEIVAFKPPVLTPNGRLPQLTTVQNLNMQAITIDGSGGQKRPAFKVTWAPPDDPTITHVVLEFGVAGSSNYSGYDTDDPETGSLVIQADVLASTTYAVRATINTQPPRPAIWSSWVQVLSNSESVAAVAIAASQAQGDLSDQVGRLFDGVGSGSHEGQQRAFAHAWLAIEEMSREYLREYDLQNDISVERTARQDFEAAFTGSVLSEAFVDQIEATVIADAQAIVDVKSAELDGAIDGLVSSIGESAHEFQVRGTAISWSVSEALLQSYVEEYNANAAISENKSAIATEGVARAQLQTSLQAQIDNTTASIASFQEAISTETTARTNLASELNAAIGDNTSKIVETREALTGETARFGHVGWAAALSALKSYLAEYDAGVDISVNKTGLVTESLARAQLETELRAAIGDNTANIATTAQAVVDEATARASFEELLNTLIAGNTASIEQNQTAITTETDARVAAVQDLRIDVDGNTANIASVSTALTDEVAARAMAVESVDAKFGDLTAGAALRFEAVAAPAGVEARIVAAVSGGNATNPAQGGFMLDVIDDGNGGYKTRMTIGTDEIYLDEALQIVNGVVRLGATELVSSLQSASFASGQNGWKLNNDGTFELGGGVFYGETSANRTFKFNAMPIKNGLPIVPLTVYPGRDGYYSSVAGFDNNVITYLSRTPDRLTATFREVETRTVSLSGGKKWGELWHSIDGSGWVFGIDKNAIVHERFHHPDGTISDDTAYERLVYPLEMDPLNEAGKTGVNNFVVAKLGWNIAPTQFIATTDTLRFHLWGAGGSSMGNGGIGGPGGFVSGTISVVPGEVLTIIIGDGGRQYWADVMLGFGGPAVPVPWVGTGGGATILLRGEETKFANIIAIAPGGGGSVGGFNGGPGGGVIAGGNGATGSDIEKMTGIDAKRQSDVYFGAGGGGFQGGGNFSAIGDTNIRPGLGGTAYLSPDVTGGQQQASGQDSVGATTNDAPPQTSLSGYQTNKGYYRGRRNAGYGGDATVAGTGGRGLALFEWL